MRPIYSEPNLANQFAYDMMFRIPGERANVGTLKEKITKKYVTDVILCR